MALKISLKPEERIIVGTAVIKNGGSRCELLIENKVPILRQKNIMAEREAITVARKIYFAVQLMYIEGGELLPHYNSYWRLVGEFLKAAPSALKLIDTISEHILGNDYYGALKLAHKLIDYEQEVMSRV